MLPNTMLRKSADDKAAVATEPLMLLSACPPAPGGHCSQCGRNLAAAAEPQSHAPGPTFPVDLMPMQAFFFMFVTCVSKSCPSTPDP